ncbi:MAG TPA: TonB-dependent receptor [Gammaproteobacteria bacterium]|jgi:iron complex outermembrane receptor protein
MRDYGPVRPGFGRAFSAASLVGISALSLAPLPAAIAQEASEAPPTGLEEIIVTSRYREENLQTTPLTISAFTGEALELRSLDNLEDIAVVVPNMFIRPNVSNFGPNNTVGLRNVIQVDFLYAFEPATGVYIDDVYHGTLTGSSIDLLDLERVEVLRGPQGTLFGKNSIGGAMRMVSRQPQGDDTGYVEATYGDYDRIDIKGVYDMALSDTLALRVSGVSKHQNGYMETVDFTCDMVRRGTPELAGIDDGIVGYNADPDGPFGPGRATPIFGVVGSPEDNAFSFPEGQPTNQESCVTGTMGGEDIQAGRLMLRWFPSDNFEINFAADRSDSSEEAPGDALIRGDQPSLFNNWLGDYYLTLWGVTPFAADDRFVPEDYYKSYATWADPITGSIWDRHYKHEAEGWSLSFDYNIGENTNMEIILANRNYLSDWTSDSDFSPFEITTTNNLEDHDQDTYEIRFSGTAANDRLEWTAGAFYYDAASFLGGRVELAQFNFFGAIPEFDQNDKFWTENKSAFFHLVYDLTDRLSVSGGYRSTDEDKKYTFDHTGFLTVTDPLFYGISRDDWKVGLDYAFTDNIFGFVSVATGYRSDGANPRPWTPGQLLPAPGEELENTEVGVKADLFDNRLRINASVYQADYDPRLYSLFGFQCEAFNSPDPGPFYAFGTLPPGNTCPPGSGNAGLPAFNWFAYFATSGVTDGVEVELSAYPTENLSIDYSLGVNSFEGDPGPGDPAYIHPTALLQPERNMSAGIQYDFNLTNGGVVSPRLDWFYQSKRTNGPLTVEQVCPQFCNPEYDYFNLRLTYLNANRDLQISLASTNVTDEFWWYQIGADTNIAGIPSRPRSGVPSAPQMWNLSLRKSF